MILHVGTCPAYEGRRNRINVRDALIKGAKVTHGGQSEDGMDGLNIEMMANTSLAASAVRPQGVTIYLCLPAGGWVPARDGCGCS